jgi:hypothetical protein
MTFNIRKLKIQINCTSRQLRTCDPRSRERLRTKLKSQEMALLIARESRLVHRTTESASALSGHQRAEFA